MNLWYNTVAFVLINNCFLPSAFFRSGIDDSTVQLCDQTRRKIRSTYLQTGTGTDDEAPNAWAELEKEMENSA